MAPFHALTGGVAAERFGVEAGIWVNYFYLLKFGGLGPALVLCYVTLIF